MADGRSPLDSAVGGEPEDIVPKLQKGSFYERAPNAPDDDKMPVKALPLRERKPPFKLTGGGSGG